MRIKETTKIYFSISLHLASFQFVVDNNISAIIIMFSSIVVSDYIYSEIALIHIEFFILIKHWFMKVVNLILHESIVCWKNLIYLIAILNAEGVIHLEFFSRTLLFFIQECVVRNTKKVCSPAYIRVTFFCLQNRGYDKIYIIWNVKTIQNSTKIVSILR